LPCIECNNALSLVNEIAPIAFSHMFADFDIFHVKHACLPSLHHMPSAMNIAIVASYYSCTFAPNGYVQVKRTMMMDDVFVYQSHTFFALLCVCVGYFDYMSTSTSCELTIRALESGPLSTDSLLYRTCLCFDIVKDAQGHAFEVTSFLGMDIVDHTSCVACTMTLCTHARDLASTCHCHIAMPHAIYALCVAFDLWIIFSTICSVGTMSSLHICHVPLLATCLS
jgi:hypothetical protein